MIFVLFLKIGEVDANRNSLDHLHVVSGRVLGGKQRKFRSGGATDLGYFAGVLLTVPSVHRQLHLLPWVHLGNLRLFEVCCDPEALQRHNRKQILTGCEVCAGHNVLLIHNAVGRRDNPRVRKIEHRLVNFGLSLLDLCQRRGRTGPLYSNLLRPVLRSFRSLIARRLEFLLRLRNAGLLSHKLVLCFEHRRTSRTCLSYCRVKLLPADNVLLNEWCVALDIFGCLQGIGFGFRDACGRRSRLLLSLEHSGARRAHIGP